MNITCSNLISKPLKKHLINVCKYTIEHAFTKRQQARLETISIRVNKNISIHDMLAYMDIENEDGTGNPTNFIIWVCPFFTKRITKRHKTYLMETIIHETIHIRQYMSGALKQIHRNGVPTIKFNKKYYKITNSNKNYWLAPWEIEARGYERGILSLYCSEYNCYDEFPDADLTER